MKSLPFLPVLALIFTLSTTHAQKVKTYDVRVFLMDNSQVKGTLYAARESELVILREDLTPVKYLPENIRALKLRRAGSIGKGAWVGAVGGCIAGAVAGYASESGSGWEDVGAIGGAIVGTPLGAIVGVVIGSGKKKYTLNGDKDRYNALLPTLEKYTPQKGHKS
ncbi:hypothetical protein [Robiginitalea sp. SC105]|uniref:hypothetical protein n=1 Tax=Robiginitalea sp. SC105 TaxID=2762332 RepID=UPI00163A792A|nr:hypothetical protein [Robiginitalea sp. SC105]MBC2838840.1 hypothetical protein [Robiginitalea sp. SC105]